MYLFFDGEKVKTSRRKPKVYPHLYVKGNLITVFVKPDFVARFKGAKVLELVKEALHGLEVQASHNPKLQEAFKQLRWKLEEIWRGRR